MNVTHLIEFLLVMGMVREGCFMLLLQHEALLAVFGLLILLLLDLLHLLVVLHLVLLLLLTQQGVVAAVAPAPRSARAHPTPAVHVRVGGVETREYVETTN